MEKNKTSIWMDLEDLTNQVDEAKSLLMTLALSAQVPGLNTDNDDVSNVAYVVHRILDQVSKDLMGLSELDRYLNRGERHQTTAQKGGVAA